jgi:aminopeptidase
MKFTDQLQTYAELIVIHGLNVQPGQLVNISTEVIHQDLAILIAEIAYQHGARMVNIDFSDSRLARLRILESAAEDLEYVPEYVSVKYRELVDQQAANLKLLGSEDPDLYAELDPKRMNTVRLHHHMAVKYFYDEGIGKSLVHWTVAAAATPKWGQKVFPNLEGLAAEAKLWEQILRICRADQPNCLALWKDHNKTLARRASQLTEMKIKTLHFQGPGTDLRVGLSPQAVFKGGTDTGPRKVEFEPNLPTEEVFTTPDWRTTEGTAQATRPFLINGKLIEGLTLHFEQGKIVDFQATQGAETFAEYTASDEGANRLGEVALVGIDSPIYQSGLVFEEILFDENAACHIAVGSAYKFCLAGGESMNEEQLAAVGCNESTVHTDMMISSEKVDVTAETYAGDRVPLLVQGAWVDFQ